MPEPTSAAERGPMSNGRLAVIRAEVTRPSKYALEHDAKDIACELLAEVDRLAARVAELEAHPWIEVKAAPGISDEDARLTDEWDRKAVREVIIGAGSPETSALTHCPACGAPEWHPDGRRGWNPVDVECEDCASADDSDPDQDHDYGVI